jgi:hypothetical protein
MLAVGCGSAHAPKPASTGTPADGSTQTAKPPTAAENKTLAGREARRLLALVPLPAGAVAISRVTVPLPGPVAPVAPSVMSTVDRHWWWRLPMPVAQAAAWIKAHRPRGLGQPDAFTEGAPVSPLTGYSYPGPANPAWASAQLEVAVGASGPGTSVMRADSVVVWLDPVPAPDNRHGRRVHVSVVGGCPQTDNSLVGVTNSGADLRKRLLPAATPAAGLECWYHGLNDEPSKLSSVTHLAAAAARQVARNMAQLRLGHARGELTNCPSDDGSAAILALSYPGRPDVDLWVDLSGCGGVANGFVVIGVGPVAGGAPACLDSGWAACLRPR